MGIETLWEGKDVLVVETLTAKLFEEEADPIKKATVSAILTQGDTHNYQMAAFIAGYATNAERYLNYGKNHYVYGLPEGFIGTLGIDIPATEAVISGIEGQAIVVTGGFIGDPILSYFGYERLRKHAIFKWDYATNRTAPVNGKIYQILNIGPTPRGELGATLRWIDDPAAGGPTWFDPTNPNFGTIAPSATTTTARLGVLPNPLNDFVHAEYYLKSEGPAHLRYWTYDISTKKYPTLDTTADALNLGSPFYPIAPIRLNDRFVSSDSFEKKRPGDYASIKALLKKIRLKPTDLEDALSGTADNPNKNLNDLDDAYFMFALDIYTRVEPSVSYLKEFFQVFSYKAPQAKAAYLAIKNKIIAALPNPSINIYDFQITGGAPALAADPDRRNLGTLTKDPVRQSFYLTEGKDFSVRLSWNYIEILKNQTGVMKDKYEREFTITPAFKYRRDNGYDMNDSPLGFTNFEYEESSVMFKERTGPNTYDAVLVHGLMHESIVRIDTGERKKVIRVLEADKIWAEDQFTRKIVGTRIVTIKNPGATEVNHSKGDSAFYIPLAFDIIDLIHKRTDRDIILYDGSMLLIQAAKMEHLEWYQTGIFRVLLMVAIFIVSVWLLMNFGPGGLTLAQAIFQIMTQMIIAWTLSIVVNLIVENVDGALGVVLATIAIVVVAYFGGFNFQSFGSMNGPAMFNNVALIADYASKISNIAAQVTGAYVKSGIAGLEDDYADIADMEAEAQKLEDAYYAMGPEDPAYNPLFIIHNPPKLVTEESVTEYYYRGLMANPGRESLKVIEAFVENALRLPESTDPEYI